MALLFRKRNSPRLSTPKSDPFTFWAFNVFVASFAVVPGAASATSIAAGVIYGTPLGVALVGTSCAVGAGVSFIIARYAARPIVEKIFLSNDSSIGVTSRSSSKFAALDQAVMRDGAQIVLLTRLSPLSPYVAMSFAFGLTAVDFVPYLLASAVGILPASTLYVYLGDTGRRAAGGSGGGGTSKLEIAFYAFGLIMTGLVTARIAKLANDALGEKVDTPRAAAGGSGRGRGRGRTAVVEPKNLWNLWGLFTRHMKRRDDSGDNVDFDEDDSDFDCYYDSDEDTNLGMLEMAERGGGRNRNERSDSDSAEGEARGDTHAGGLLVSDPMARPVPLGSPSKKT